MTWRRASLAAAAVAALATSACAAGQQAQTAEETNSIDGANAQVGDIAVRDLAVISPPKPSGYDVTASAPLTVVIVNTSESPDTLTDISTDAAADWSTYKTAARAADPDHGAHTTHAVSLPAGARVSFGVSSIAKGVPGSAGLLELLNLTHKLYPGTQITVRLTFAKAGSVSVVVPVQISATPPPAQTIPPISSGAA